MSALTARQAAAFLGIHLNTLWRLAKSGELPGRKVGRDWRFLEDELRRYLTGEVQSSPGVASAESRPQ